MANEQENLTASALVFLEGLKDVVKKKDEELQRQQMTLTDLKQQYDTLLTENHTLKFKLEEANQEYTTQDLKHRNDMQILIDRMKQNNEDSRNLIMSLDLRARDAEARAEEAEEKTKKLFEDMAGTMNRALSAFPSLSQLPSEGSSRPSALLRRSFTVPPASRSPSPTKQTSKRPLKENRTPDRQSKKHRQEVISPYRRAATAAPQSQSLSQRIGLSSTFHRATFPTSPVPDSEEELEAPAGEASEPTKCEPTSSPAPQGR